MNSQLFKFMALITGALMPQLAAGDTFPEWQLRNFGGGRPESVSGPLSDPDFDGRSNLMEYALGTNPLYSDSAGISAPYFFEDKLTFSVSRPKGLGDLLFYFQVTGSLTGAWEGGAQVQWLPVLDLGDFETITGQDMTLASTATKRFIRLGVTVRDVDGNNNGVFDAWEILSFGHLGESGTGDADGDGVPDREDADPFNPAIGRLSITISSPANGSTNP